MHDIDQDSNFFPEPKIEDVSSFWEDKENKIRKQIEWFGSNQCFLFAVVIAILIICLLPSH